VAFEDKNELNIPRQKPKDTKEKLAKTTGLKRHYS